jgi:methionine-rich copper-binding protein CopC
MSFQTARSIRSLTLLVTVAIVNAAILMMVTLLMPTVPSARAHAEYERSEPAPDAVIAAAPTEVHIWFSQELFRRAGENTLEVTGPDGSRVDTGDAQLDDDDRKHLFVPLAENLPEGLYTVRWRNLSAEDGDTDEGEFTFTVGSGASPAAEEVVTGTSVITSVTAPTSAPTVTEAPTAPPPSPTVGEAAASDSEKQASPGGLPCLGSAGLALAAMAVVITRRSRPFGGS